MAAATVHEKFLLSGENEEMHDVTFAATADTHAAGVNVKAYTYGVTSCTGTEVDLPILSLSGNTFTLTVLGDGTPNTAYRMWIRILKKR